MIALWGLGLGLMDGAFFTLMRNSYAIWNKSQRVNSPANGLTKVWQNLLLACMIAGFIVPYLYFWANYSVGSISEIHIYRCLISLLLSIFIGIYIYGDTFNQYTGIGLLFAFIGLCMVLLSTRYGQGEIGS
jgi:uncharacterized membrane protein